MLRTAATTAHAALSGSEADDAPEANAVALLSHAQQALELESDADPDLAALAADGTLDVPIAGVVGLEDAHDAFEHRLPRGRLPHPHPPGRASMNPRIYLATTRRILQQLRADHRTMALIVVVPTLLLTLLYFVFNDERRFSPIAKHSRVAPAAGPGKRNPTRRRLRQVLLTDTPPSASRALRRSTTFFSSLKFGIP